MFPYIFFYNVIKVTMVTAEEQTWPNKAKKPEEKRKEKRPWQKAQTLCRSWKNTLIVGITLNCLKHHLSS